MNKPVAQPKPLCACPTCFGIVSGRIQTSMGLGKVRRK